MLSGVRRIEAITGSEVIKYMQKQQRSLENLAKIAKSPINQLEDNLIGLIAKNKELQKKNSTKYAKNL